MTKTKTSIQPWLTVQNCTKAGIFYKAAFNATEAYRMETPDGGLVLKLAVDEAEFWVSGQIDDSGEPLSENLGGDTLKMVLIVDDPDTFFSHALKHGATEIFPVGEEHGWRLGRLVDPFGLHWEIGKQLAE